MHKSFYFEKLSKIPTMQSRWLLKWVPKKSIYPNNLKEELEEYPTFPLIYASSILSPIPPLIKEEYFLNKVRSIRN